MSLQQGKIGRALRAAFPHTIPILAGYWFLGLTLGIYMRSSGLSFWYSVLNPMFVFGGSLEFLLVSLLCSPFAPLQVFVMALIVQARHLFYGLSMIERYRGFGWKKFFIIFMMADETFSVTCAADIPKDVDEGWFMLWGSVLDYCYWLSAVVTGALVGSFLSFSMKGLDFSMTAMFTVVFTERLLKEKSVFSPLTGVAVSVACLWLFGPQNFLIPAMALILAVLTVFRQRIAKAGDYE